MPRVYKWNEETKSIAADCKSFVDDFRIVGPTRDLTKQATHRLETTMSYLGIQDATRKRRDITQRPGKWTGSIVLSVADKGLFVTVSQKKWDKASGIIQRWKSKFDDVDLPKLCYKQLESDVGFLVHLAMTYDTIKLFLRGFYLTLNSWREGRDKDGWKLSSRVQNIIMNMSRYDDDDDDDEGLSSVLERGSRSYLLPVL